MTCVIMITQKNLDLLKKQHYIVAGKHSAVQICRWNKHALVGEGECYKYKFYGIPSWRCCEITPWVGCENRCMHCWRAIESDLGEGLNKKNIDSPEKIIEGCIKGRKKLLTGFGGHSRLNKERYREAQEPSHFAISLIGEPTLYPKIGEMISLLRKQGKTSFIVTNGLHPEVIARLKKKNQLPTQLYVSLNASDEKMFNEWHKSKMKNAWKKYNETLDLLNKITKKGKRTVLRMTLVKGKNMSDEDITGFARIIKKASPNWVEVKGFISVGYARNRLPYDRMPKFEEIRKFAIKLARKTGYKVVDKHIPSRIILLGKNKEAKKIMKIQKI